ncbi:MAG: nucleotidyltransferase domain-containing protein [Candidatus Zixiibacteriota bacterium]|nr:MAG: nucleotidyltransferase domain-containing protein [candidate division Zixibacteria bacterium]
MARRLADTWKPEKIILFGSYARGNPTPDSDVDLLVIMEYSGRKWEVIHRMRQSLADFDVPKDIVIRTPAEVERFGRFVGTILYPALKEGQVLYARD